MTAATVRILAITACTNRRPNAAWLMAVLIACSCSPSGGATGQGPMGPAHDGSAGAQSEAGSHEGGIWVPDAESGAPCSWSCSADLHSVVDCHGSVVTQCGDDQGCANATCIDNPCQAAELSESSRGCEYWAVRTDLAPVPSVQGACFAAFVANTWPTPVHLTAYHDGVATDPSTFVRIPVGQGESLAYQAYDPGAGLAPGQVAILFLAHGPFTSQSQELACPAGPLSYGTGVQGTGRGKAFRIVTDRPVVAYQILPFGGGASAVTSATLLLPTNTWKTSYLAINPYQQGVAGRPSLDVLALHDETLITLVPTAPIEGGPDVAPAPAGKPASYTLASGEYLQLTQAAELTGSAIVADKPIGVWGAADCFNVPADRLWCDSAQQQLLPVTALGSEYVAVRHRGRRGQDEPAHWRLVGVVDDTVLSFDPPNPAAPTSIHRGETHDMVTTGPFVVKSQDADHPFHASAYMTGNGGASLFDGEGDPEWVTIVPTTQYLENYVFFTDPTYSETSLVVVRKSGPDGGFADVVLDCRGVLTDWHPVGAYEYTRVDLVTGNFEGVAGCANGRRSMTSSLPFAVTVWGWGTKATNRRDVSYAYPAGVSVRTINEVPPLVEPPR